MMHGDIANDRRKMDAQQQQQQRPLSTAVGSPSDDYDVNREISTTTIQEDDMNTISNDEYHQQQYHQKKSVRFQQDASLSSTTKNSSLPPLPPRGGGSSSHQHNQVESAAAASAKRVGISSSSQASSSPQKSNSCLTGIRLSYLLDDFLDIDCGGQEQIQNWTTSDVYYHIIKPMIVTNSPTGRSTTTLSFCDLLKRQGLSQAYGDIANVFVSHVHSDLFLNLLSSLEYKFRHFTDVVLWIDIFCCPIEYYCDLNNTAARGTVSSSYNWISMKLPTLIQQIGKTVLVTSSALWEDQHHQDLESSMNNHPILPWTRLWCLWEIYCSKNKNNSHNKNNSSSPSNNSNVVSQEDGQDCSSSCLNFDIAMNHDVESRFLFQLQIDSQRVCSHLQSIIKSEASRCTLDCDRQVILGVIRTTIDGNFKQLDTTIYGMCYDWLLHKSNQAFEDARDRQRRRRSSSSRSSSTDEYNNNNNNNDDDDDEGSIVIEEEDEGSTITNGETTWLRAIGLLHLAKGNYEEAETNLTDCIERSKEISWDQSTCHKNTAEEVEGRDYDIYAIMNDEEHPDILLSMYHLGRVLNLRRKYTEAKTILIKCLEGRKTILGKYHPETMDVMDLLAIVYRNLGNLYESEYLYEICYERRKSVLGEYDPQTLSTMYNLAIVYFFQGKYNESRSLCELCLERRRDIHGEAHTNTISTMSTLALIYCEQGLNKEGQEMYLDLWDLQRALYGVDHPDTIRTMEYLKLLGEKMS